MLDSMGWQNVQQLINTAVLNLTKNALDGFSSTGINKMFKSKQPTKPRQKAGIRISHKGKISSKSKIYQVAAPGLFNQLPFELRNPILSGTKFKKDLKKHLAKKHLLPKH